MVIPTFDTPLGLVDTLLKVCDKDKNVFMTLSVDVLNHHPELMEHDSLKYAILWHEGEETQDPGATSPLSVDEKIQKIVENNLELIQRKTSGETSFASITEGDIIIGNRLQSIELESISTLA